MKFKESKSIYLQIADQISEIQILQGQYAEEATYSVCQRIHSHGV